MTQRLKVDQGRNNPLPFDQADLDRCGIRVRPAEFARLMGCSKQAVSRWLTQGKITLGADGRIDPASAVSQLMRNSDPAKLRARALRPLLEDVLTGRRRILALEGELAEARDQVEFSEGASHELLAHVEHIVAQLVTEWEALRALPADVAVAAFVTWEEQALQTPPPFNFSIADFVPTCAPAAQGKGAGNSLPSTYVEDSSR